MSNKIIFDWILSSDATVLFVKTYKGSCGRVVKLDEHPNLRYPYRLEANVNSFIANMEMDGWWGPVSSFEDGKEAVEDYINCYEK